MPAETSLGAGSSAFLTCTRATGQVKPWSLKETTREALTAVGAMPLSQGACGAPGRGTPGLRKTLRVSKGYLTDNARGRPYSAQLGCREQFPLRSRDENYSSGLHMPSAGPWPQDCPVKMDPWKVCVWGKRAVFWGWQRRWIPSEGVLLWDLSSHQTYTPSPELTKAVK